MTNDCQLYVITPPTLEPVTFAPLLAAALDTGAVAALQLRLPGVDGDTLRRAIDVLRPVAQSRDVAFLLEGDPALAAQTGCDGAHVGEAEIDVASARKALGPDLQLGVSCYGSRELAMLAGEAGADYVSFGAFFPSSTKPTESRADLALVEWWSELMELPCVAVGGLNAENCGPIVKAGADFVAVVGAVWSHPGGPAAGVRAMRAAIDTVER